MAIVDSALIPITDESSNRYAQLQALQPQGSFWDASGLVLPYRDASPYEFLFVGLPSTTYAISVNGIATTPTSTITTDASGQAVISIGQTDSGENVLQAGQDYELQINATRTNDAHSFYVTIRNSATMLAAEAETVESVDTTIQDVRDGQKIELARSDLLEETFGRMVVQPNDFEDPADGSGAFSVETYRQVLRDLREAYRYWASRPAGLRQAVASITGVDPLRLPREWIRRWVLDDQNNIDPDLTQFARTTTSDLSVLNSTDFQSGVARWVHAPVGAASLGFPGPFKNPEDAFGAELLAFVFESSWDGGNIVMTGIDSVGIFRTETILAVASGTVLTTRRYKSISSATNQSAGTTGTCSIGLGESKFLTLDAIGSRSPTRFAAYPSSSLYQLEWLGTPKTLSFGLTTPFADGAIEALASGTYEVAGSVGVSADYVSLRAATFNTTSQKWIAFEIDRLGKIEGSVTSAGALTAANAVVSLNALINRHPGYGGVRATLTITINPQPVADDSFELTDASYPTAIVQKFIFDPSVPAGGDNAVVIGGTTTITATNLAAAITKAGFAMYATSATNVVTVRQGYASNSGGNTAVTNIVGTSLDFNSGTNFFAGGTDSPSYSTAASVVTDAGGSTYARLLSVAQFESSSIDLYSSAAPDALESVFGLPTSSAGVGVPQVANVLAGGGVSAGARTVNVTSLALFPPLPVIEIGTVDSNAATSTIADPGTSTALEMIFDTGWDRGTGVEADPGSITVTGTDCHDETVTETFSPSSVFNGTFVSHRYGTIVVEGTAMPSGAVASLSLGASYPDIKVGMRFFTGTGSAFASNFANSRIIDYVGESALGVTAIHFRSTIAILVNWRITKPTTIAGTNIFRTVTGIVPNGTVGTGGAEHTAYLRILGSESMGYDVRIGRGALASFTNAVTVTPSGTAPFPLATITPVATLLRPMHIGGKLLVADLEAPAVTGVPGKGTNNGLHDVLSVAPASIGTDTWRVRHEKQLRGQGFVTETLVSSTYTSYAAGELVRVIGVDTSTVPDMLTLASPAGMIDSFSSGARVETETLPISLQGPEKGFDRATVTINYGPDEDGTFLPLADVVGDVLVYGEPIPDGWLTDGVTRTGALAQQLGAHDFPGLFDNTLGVVLRKSASGTTITFSRHFPRALLFKGFKIRPVFWASQHSAATRDMQVDISFDGGVNFTTGGVTAVPRSFGTVTGQWAKQSTCVPFDSSGNDSLQIPSTATDIIVRLQVTGLSSGDIVSVARCVVTVDPADSLFLSDGTVPLSDTQSAFGEMLYVWCPDEMNAQENVALGVLDHAGNAAPGYTDADGVFHANERGHIDRITNAHGWWDRANITQFEFDGTTAINVVGVQSENDWIALEAIGNLINLELTVGTPGRLSYVSPMAISAITDELTFSATPHLATTTAPSLHEGFLYHGVSTQRFPNQASSLEWLTADDVPIPSTPLSQPVKQFKTFSSNTGGDVLTVYANEPTSPTLTGQVDSVGTGPRPLSAAYDNSTGKLTITLAADATGATIATQNTTIQLAEVVNALDGFSATFTGTGLGVFNADSISGSFTAATAPLWYWNAQSQIALNASEFDGAKMYALTFEQMTRATSDVLDLGATYANFLWFYDARCFRRADVTIVEREVSAPLAFRSNLTAVLTQASNQDLTTSQLVSDNGQMQVTVPTTRWRYVNGTTVQIDRAAFNSANVYTLTYTRQDPQPTRVAQMKIEARSASGSGSLPNVEWREVHIDETANSAHRYHQVRVTFTGIVDVRDLRLFFMGLRGVELFGGSPDAPGIIPCGDLS